HFKENPTAGYGYDVTQISGAKHFEKAIRKFPRLRFVVPHFGFEEMDRFVGMLDDYPNLHLDTTMTLANFFPHKIDPGWFERHSERILFGTDFPNIPYEWSREKDGLLALGLGEGKEAAILYCNAHHLLDLKETP